MNTAIPTSSASVRFLAIRRTLPGAADAQRLFAALTRDGAEPGSVLLQSSDNIPRYGERSLAAVGASLRITGLDDGFRVTALDRIGRCLLPGLHESLAPITRQLHVAEGELTGRLDIDRTSVSARLRPLRRNAMEVLRTVAFIAPPDEPGPIPSHGLFGAFAYTFVHQYENFERNPRDVLGDPDYTFFLATRLFVIDHAAGATHVVASVPIVSDADLAPLIVEAEQGVQHMARCVADAPPRSAAPWTIGELSSDTPRGQFVANVERIKHDIVQGRAFQVVYGRMLSTAFEGSPFDVYARLSRIEPAPYMFYLNDGEGVLLAASPEMAVRVTNEPAGRRVELRPIAGTKPRGRLYGRIDPLTDAKYETALKIDPKELAEHTMLVDLARNDLAAICRPGSTLVDEPFVVEKYSQVQHLVSTVKGLLREDLDALHAYLATMNMGTVTGAPKLEAMRMINALENSNRGYFAGGVGYIFPDGQMDTALVIRAIRFKHGRTYVRAAAGIVADSVPESEWQETENKAAASLRVLQEHM